MAGKRFITRWLLVCLLLAIVLILHTTTNLINNVVRWKSGGQRHHPRPLVEEADAEREAVEVVAMPSPTDANSPQPSDSWQHITTTRALVVARIMGEDVSWVFNSSELSGDTALERIIYTVDDPQSPYKVPANKGHEAMTYLTYIIDRYNTLPNISIFTHSEQYTWHNNDLLNSDTALMVQRLSSEAVLRNGYMNLRCHHEPGCPAHLHPASADVFLNTQPEEMFIKYAWDDLFPGVAVPEVLSQPCCAQFALSADRIRSLPLSQYRRYRDWLLKTDLDDILSGRIFEYLWQYIWLGQEEHCPVEHICYCDGYGVCFGGQKPYDEWFAMQKELAGLVPTYKSMQKQDVDDPAAAVLRSHEAVKLVETMNWLSIAMQRTRTEAFLRGNDPRNRALEAGRSWSEGDGY